MKSPSDIYRLLVSLAAVNDADLITDLAREHADEYHPGQLGPFLRVAPELAQLIEDYDYTSSKTFLESVHGKSAAVTSMKRKIAQEPANRKLYRQQFIQSLLGLPENRDAYVLVADNHHETLNKILIAFTESHRATHAMSQTGSTDTWDSVAKEALVGAVNEWNSLASEPDSPALQWTISHETGHQKPAGQLKFGKFSIDVFIKKTYCEPYCGYFEFVMRIPETPIPPAGRHTDCLNTVLCKLNCFPMVKEADTFIVDGVVDHAQISEISTGRELAARAKNLTTAGTLFVECMAKRKPWWKLWWFPL